MVLSVGKSISLVPKTSVQTTSLNFQQTSSPPVQSYGGYGSQAAQNAALQREIQISRERYPDRFKDEKGKTFSYVQNIQKNIPQQPKQIKLVEPRPITIQQLQSSHSRSVQNPNPVTGNVLGSVHGEFLKGVENVGQDYYNTFNPDHKSKSALNKGIDHLFQGDINKAGQVVYDAAVENPAKFAGEVAVEAATFIVPVGPALKLGKIGVQAVKNGVKVLTDPVVISKVPKVKLTVLENAIDAVNQGKTGAVESVNAIIKDIKQTAKTVTTPKSIKQEQEIFGKISDSVIKDSASVSGIPTKYKKIANIRTRLNQSLKEGGVSKELTGDGVTRLNNYNQLSKQFVKRNQSILKTEKSLNQGIITNQKLKVTDLTKPYILKSQVGRKVRNVKQKIKPSNVGSNIKLFDPRTAGMNPKSTLGAAKSTDPSTIYLSRFNYKATPKTAEDIVSHETIHNTLDKMGLDTASYAFDNLVYASPKAMRKISKTMGSNKRFLDKSNISTSPKEEIAMLKNSDLQKRKIKIDKILRGDIPSTKNDLISQMFKPYESGGMKKSIPTTIKQSELNAIKKLQVVANDPKSSKLQRKNALTLLEQYAKAGVISRKKISGTKRYSKNK
jgi:hypothetical protein